jgi:[acyl-carrier-protein] S-malonyltransferase
VVEAVNFNSPGQVVIAGDKAAVLRAIEIARTRGAKRAIELPVSVPSHSSLMKAAGARLGERLAKTEVRAPRIRYVSAVDAQAHDAPDDIRALLVRQLSSPVRWTSTVAALAGEGARQVVECGPGGVLAGLVKRITRGGDIQTFALESPENFASATSAALGLKEHTNAREQHRPGDGRFPRNRTGHCEGPGWRRSPGHRHRHQ